MTKSVLKPWLVCLALLVPVAGCDDDDDDGDTGGDSANATEGGDEGDEAGGDEAGGEEGSQTCSSAHQCINDVCTCQTPGLVDMPCTDDEACVEECEICE